MYKLVADSLGKKYFYQWVFKKISFELNSGDRLLVTGQNGSGKSTLAKIIAGQTTHTEGSIQFYKEGKTVDPSQLYAHIAWTGPYFELYPDLTIEESVRMHYNFQNCLLNSVEEVIQRLEFSTKKNKKILHLSSGMLQRLKVGMCIFSARPILILDEAVANLDDNNAEIIRTSLNEFQNNRILIYISNTTSEFSRFDNQLNLDSFNTIGKTGTYPSSKNTH